MRIRWPGQKAMEARIVELEHRADSSYTDALVASITANASGESTAYPTATGALEACAGFVGRSFAVAEVKADERVLAALSPACLSMAGRSLIRRGELVMLIQIRGSRVTLLPAASHDVDGDGDPDTWRYRITVGGPEKTRTYESVAASGVVHLVYSRDPETPWRGAGPLQVAQLAGRLSAETVAALADESSGPRGSFLSVPIDGEDPTIATMKASVRTAKGKMLLAQGGDWDSGATGGPAFWFARRFGPEPGPALVELLKCASTEVYAACGLNPALFTSEGESGAREAYRQALHSTIAPLGRLVAHELSVKLESEITLDWMGASGR